MFTCKYLVAVAKKIVQYSLKLKIELMAEFSEAKIYKIKSELRNSTVNADYFYSSGEIFESVGRCAEFVYDKTRINLHMSANAS